MTRSVSGGKVASLEGERKQYKARNVKQRKREVKGLILARRAIVVKMMKGMRDGCKSYGEALVLE